MVFTANDLKHNINTDLFLTFNLEVQISIPYESCFSYDDIPKNP